MKYSIIVSLVAAIPCVMGQAAARVRADADAQLAARDAVDAQVEAELMPRACVATKCNCLAIPNGLFCGDGLLNCKKGNVYQCGGDGKLSCDYGVRNSCKKCNKLSC
ncbi:hypothetical protein V8F06_011652 [Rhypophila decipiens]